MMPAAANPGFVIVVQGKTDIVLHQLDFRSSVPACGGGMRLKPAALLI